LVCHAAINDLTDSEPPRTFTPGILAIEYRFSARVQYVSAAGGLESAAVWPGKCA
jgi:hypothetical protein